MVARCAMPSSRQLGRVGKTVQKYRRSLQRPTKNRTGFPRLRSVGPERLPLRRGRAPIPERTFTSAERKSALHALHADMFAKTTWKVVASLHRTNDRLRRCYGMELMPFNVNAIFSLAAALKLQKYRSAKKNYLSAASIEAERRGTVMTGTLRRAFKDSVRSCARGIGPGKRCEGLIFELLPGLPGGRLACCSEGPMNPRSVLMINSWFMNRDS